MQSAVKKRKQEDMDAPAWTRPVSSASTTFYLKYQIAWIDGSF